MTKEEILKSFENKYDKYLVKPKWNGGLKPLREIEREVWINVLIAAIGFGLNIFLLTR